MTGEPELRPVSGTPDVRVRELGPLEVSRARPELSREMDGPERERT